MRVVFDTNVLLSAFLWQKRLKIISCGASFIVSGDKHLLKLRKFQNILILTPKEFLKIVRK